MYKCTYTHRDADGNLVQQGTLITDADFNQVENGLQLYYTEHSEEDFSKYMWQSPITNEIVSEFEKCYEEEHQENFVEEFTRDQEEMNKQFSAPFNEF
jgi:hypothetical protein